MKQIGCGIVLAIGLFSVATAPVFSDPPKQDDIEVTDPAKAEQADVAFERLKSLQGRWHKAGEPQHGLSIEFYTTAGGTVLVEEWLNKGKPHSLTLYHRDDETLVATHYCPQGNQPRLELVSGDGIAFTFRDATDLDMAKEHYQHDLKFEWDGQCRLIRSETYRDGEGRVHPARLVLEPAR